MHEDGYCPYVTVYEPALEDPEPSPVLGLDGRPCQWYHAPKRRIGFNLKWEDDDE